MLYRDLGKTGIKVSEIGFGAWAIGGAAEAGGAPLGWGGSNDDESRAANRRARGFYEHLGFRPETVRYVKEVGPAKEGVTG